MRRKGFTLIEVLIAIFLIGVITAAFFPPLSQGISMMIQTKKFTKATFTTQEKIEQQILKLNEGDSTDWTDSNITMFRGSSSIDVPLKIKKVQAEDNSVILLALSKERKFLPELPEIDKVNLAKTKPNVFTGRVFYKNKKSDPSKNWEQDVEFCLYRWYLGDIKYLGSNFNEKNTEQLTLIKEYNPIREDGKGPLFDKEKHFIEPVLEPETELDIEGKKYSIIAGSSPAPQISLIPNTKSSVTTEKTMDEFWKNSLNLKTSDVNNFEEEEMRAFYANKGIVFSAIPIAKNSGNLGRETYSEMLSLDFNDPALSYELTLGIVPVPQVVGDEHLVEAIVQINSKLTEIDQKKFEIKVTRSSDNETVFHQGYVTNEKGYFPAVFELNTDNSYTVKVQSLSIPNLSVEGNISFLKPNMFFVDAESSYISGKIVKLKAKVVNESNEAMKGATVVYEVYNASNEKLRTQVTKSDRDGYVIMNTKCKDKGEYYVVAKLKYLFDTEIKREHRFKIVSGS